MSIRANSYRLPDSPAPEMAQTADTPAREMPPLQPEPMQQPDRHAALLTEWHRHHGSDWLRADELHPAVRRMIDAAQDRTPIRQKLRQQVGTKLDSLKLETRRSGSAALYRVT